jgi:hypothetical protein
MMKLVALAAAVLTALALPAAAQALPATSSAAAASAAALATSERARLQPSPRDTRALAMAAFARPPGELRAGAFARDRAAHSGTVYKSPLLVKDEWLADDGLRLAGTRIAYKARF